MSKVLILMAGGGIGTLLRYGMAGLVHRFSSGAFPTGTLAVNLIGSFIIGCAWAFFERSLMSPNIRLFFMVGLLGGFTTFSTFALENFNLIRDGSLKFFLINVQFFYFHFSSSFKILFASSSITGTATLLPNCL